MTCVAFSIKFARTNQKFAENSELKICEKNSLLFKIIHFTPYSGFGVADAFTDVARPSSTGGAVEDVNFDVVDGTATEYEGKNLWFMTRRRLQLIAKRLNSGDVK